MKKYIKPRIILVNVDTESILESMSLEKNSNSEYNKESRSKETIFDMDAMWDDDSSED